MSDITKDKILRLERVALAIADSIFDEYEELKSSDSDKQKKMKTVLCRFSEIADILKEGDADHGHEG